MYTHPTHTHTHLHTHTHTRDLSPYGVGVEESSTMRGDTELDAALFGACHTFYSKRTHSMIREHIL